MLLRDRKNGDPEVEAFILTDVESWEALKPRQKQRLDVAVRSTRPSPDPTDEPVLLRRR